MLEEVIYSGVDFEVSNTQDRPSFSLFLSRSLCLKISATFAAPCLLPCHPLPCDDENVLNSATAGKLIMKCFLL